MTDRQIIGDKSAIISVVEMWLQRPQTNSVAKRSHCGCRLCETEALALVLSYLRSTWDHYYRLSWSGVNILKIFFT